MSNTASAASPTDKGDLIWTVNAEIATPPTGTPHRNTSSQPVSPATATRKTPGHRDVTENDHQTDRSKHRREAAETRCGHDSRTRRPTVARMSTGTDPAPPAGSFKYPHHRARHRQRLMKSGATQRLLRVSMVAEVLGALLSSCGGGAGHPALTSPAPTVTVTVGVTATVTVTSAAPAPSAYPRGGVDTQPDGETWAVRTPAGMGCVFDATTVTCMVSYDSGAAAMRWRVGAAQAEKADALTVPDDAAELAYGARRSAGSWTLQMSQDGITFTHNGTGAHAMFNRAGVQVS